MHNYQNRSPFSVKLSTTFSMQKTASCPGSLSVMDGRQPCNRFSRCNRFLMPTRRTGCSRDNPIASRRQCVVVAGFSSNGKSAPIDRGTFPRRLHQSEGSIQEIAMHLGFSKTSYFCSVFKTRVGSTPLQYRKSNLDLA
ncbi:helix-turn-helix domain-containing protein [Paenibacillus hodogayensis]|uniref:Helix-turn-helix domain-containing protein n=1 Tax=Paenibacillus hodogayensis TaxID=279208 RepID=A0ABV5VPW2_9BACL